MKTFREYIEEKHHFANGQLMGYVYEDLVHGFINYVDEVVVPEKISIEHNHKVSVNTDSLKDLVETYRRIQGYSNKDIMIALHSVKQYYLLQDDDE